MSSESIAAEVMAGCFAARSRRLARAVSRVYDDHLRPLGLRSSQLTILVAIADGTTRPVDIGRRLDLEKSTVTRAIQLMETNGWIDRRPDSAAVNLSLTKAGEELLNSSIGPWRQATAEIANRLEGADVVPYITDPTT